MVSIDVTKIASQLKDGAKVALKNLKENPAEGSVFDAAKKLGINNKEDLKAGIELFKEDPTGTVNSAIQTLSEKGFKFGGTEESPKEFSVDNIGKSQTAQKTATKTATKTQTPQIAQNTTTDEVEEETTETKNNTQEFGGVFGKLGIKNEADLQAAVQKFKENPKETAQSIAKTLGLSDNLTSKLSSIISKFTKA